MCPFAGVRWSLCECQGVAFNTWPLHGQPLHWVDAAWVWVWFITQPHHLCDCRYGLVNEGNIKALTRELLDYLAVSDAEFKPDLVRGLCLAACNFGLVFTQHLLSLSKPQGPWKNRPRAEGSTHPTSLSPFYAQTAKIATLIQRFAPDKRWHIDNLVQLMTQAGAYVKEEVGVVRQAPFRQLKHGRECCSACTKSWTRMSGITHLTATYAAWLIKHALLTTTGVPRSHRAHHQLGRPACVCSALPVPQPARLPGRKVGKAALAALPSEYS